jgi:hypothetical protein
MPRRQFSERDLTTAPVPVLRLARTILRKSTRKTPPCAAFLREFFSSESQPRSETLDGKKRSVQNKNCLAIRSGAGPRLASRRFRCSSLRLPIEEQGLADHRLDRVGAEGLGDKERRLGRLTREKPFRKRGYENNGNFLNP